MNTPLSGLCGHLSPLPELTDCADGCDSVLVELEGIHNFNCAESVKPFACTRPAGHTGTHRSAGAVDGGNVEWPHDTLLELTDNQIAIHTRHYRGRTEQLVGEVRLALDLDDAAARKEITTWLMMGAGK